MKTQKHFYLLLILAVAGFLAPGESSAHPFRCLFTNVYHFTNIYDDGGDGSYEDARASAVILQYKGRTSIHIRVDGAPPNSLFTAWLRMATPNPLTGRKSTPLANTNKIDDLGAITPQVELTDQAIAIGLTGDDGTGASSAANSANAAS